MGVKVLVNGIGVIGKRVAEAVKLQDDMDLVGVSDIAPTSVLRILLGKNGSLRGTKLYSSLKEAKPIMEEAGLQVEGILEEVLGSGEVEVVVDCTPAGIGAKNKPIYEKHGVKSIYQGGEKAVIAPISFVAVANYEKALNAPSARVVSCNTTSLTRTIYALDSHFGVSEVFAALVRRAADPWNEKKGPVNAVIPEVHVPSHQGPDLQTVLPHINIITMAVKVPTTTVHVHVVRGKTKKDAAAEEIREVFEDSSRIILIKESQGFTATSELMEMFRDLKRPRSDMYEVAVWDESITVVNSKFHWIHAVHSEAIVIPENIDAIRAVACIETDKMRSIEKTNKSLGIY